MTVRATLVALTPAGPPVSSVVAGVMRMTSWNWSPPERLRWLEQCLDLGVTTFDHADIYGGYEVERQFGEALRLAPALRQRMQLITKCGIRLTSPARPEHRIKHYDTSASHICASVDHSLRALGTDRLDLLLLHRPDALMDADDVAGAFDQLRGAGKVAAFGVSNFTPAQFDLLHSRTPLVTNQIELHPLHRAPLTDGTLDQCQQQRMRPLIWGPLAGGALFRDADAAARRVRGALEQIAATRGTSPATVAYAWLTRLPSHPVPIVGSRRLETMAEAVASLSMHLDAQEWTEILVAAAGEDVP